jgi:hypothetical protein
METLAAYWRFNEVQAGKVLDASGHGNNAHLGDQSNISPKPLQPNTPISDEDEWGEKVQLGHSVFGDVGSDQVNFIEPGNRTFELYVRRLDADPETARNPFLSLNDIISLRVSQLSNLEVDVEGRRMVLDKRLVIKEWTHVAVVVEDSGLTILADGVPAGSAKLETSISDDSCAISVGGKGFEITEVRIWSSARSESDIKQYMKVALPRQAPVSKWKGLRINLQADASSKAWSKQIPEAASVPVNRTRRVFEEKAPSIPSRVEVDENESRERNKTPELSAELPKSSGPFNYHPDAEKEPDRIAPPPREVSSSVLSDRPVPAVEQTVEKYYSRAKTSAPMASVESKIEVKVQETPILVPVSLPEALSLFDSLLERGILNRGFDFDRSELLRIVQAISSYVRSQYRLGPYLAPMPPEDILTRLRIVASYLAVISVLSNDSPWGSLPALRLSLLREHIPEMLSRCISEATNRNDHACAAMLARTFLTEFGTSISYEQAEGIKKHLTTNIAALAVTCPFCSMQLKDPLQAGCIGGCGTKYALCFLTGNIVPRDDCAKCQICSTVVSVRSQIFKGRYRGNVPTNISLTMPKACFVCGCIDSLSPLR